MVARSGSRRRSAPALLFVLAALAAGCAAPTPPPTPRIPSTPEPESFKVLTYNTLHGLNVGRLWVKPGEAPEQREARFRLQVKEIARVKPAVILLQEVNPLPDRAEDYVKALAEFGLAYTQVHQVDACGIRLAPQVALIPALNNGLAILALAELTLEKVEGLKLSGPGFCGDRVGFQLGELRYALIASVTSPKTGNRYLIADVHLHSGIEGDGYLLRRLNQAKADGRLKHVDDLERELIQDQRARIEELDVLLAELRRLNANGAYATVLIGGDFNFEPGDPEYRELVRLGLTDSYTRAVHDGELASYDPRYDALTEEDATTVPEDLKRKLVPLYEEERAAIEAAYLADVRRPRRIDFLFTLSTLPPSCITQELFGVEPSPGGMPGSDHYGVLNTYTYRGGVCPDRATRE
jgi:endonuclease/exonuclease/phosphatase family metal-dependent hydrolase